MATDEQQGEQGAGLGAEVEAFLREAAAALPSPGQAARPDVAAELRAVQICHQALALLVASYHRGLLAQGMDGEPALVLAAQFQGVMLGHANAAVTIMADRLRRAAEGQ